MLLVVALGACGQENARLSLDEARSCAVEAFGNHSGTFSLGENAIAYSFESPNGPARVLVIFDVGRRPVRTVFDRTPYGSHQELMEAAKVIKDCVAYGPKALGERYKGGATSMIGPRRPDR